MLRRIWNQSGANSQQRLLSSWTTHQRTALHTSCPVTTRASSWWPRKAKKALTTATVTRCRYVGFFQLISRRTSCYAQQVAREQHHMPNTGKTLINFTRFRAPYIGNIYYANRVHLRMFFPWTVSLVSSSYMANRAKSDLSPSHFLTIWTLIIGMSWRWIFLLLRALIFLVSSIVATVAVSLF